MRSRTGRGRGAAALLPRESRRGLRGGRGSLADAGCTIYFARVHEAYGSFFDGPKPPARVAIGVAALPKGADVEIDAIVAL